ncbi:hypothetical protein KFL_001140100 [Klebsormidium nitens]|uniref:CASP-like protein n=1 Tax=Klebsormidium nitens TaxID=105231 RepID=A0A1Y1HXN4_KLENI|nr:hypothetical protein KFL_001140100 [Klebsormidium nitens]|eukprot:GAQ82522.1 hypothetical protein KFL_001140100 [Klebsormidium nitens]
MDHTNSSNHRPRPTGNKWGAGRPPPPPLSMQEGLPPAASSGYGRHLMLEDRPKSTAMLSLGIRSLQALCSLVSFSLMASSNQSYSYHTGFTKISVNLHYSDFPPFSFLVAAMVLTFVWSLGILLRDLFELCGWGRLQLARWRIWACFLTDTLLVLLSFGAGCAAAGVTTINGLLCDSQIQGQMCGLAKAAAGFAFCAWASLLPTFGFALICVFREYN